jgi:hypothetical protein
MNGLIYVWGSGLLVLIGLEIYVGTLALRNLAPGVDRKNLRLYRKLAAQTDENVFNELGQRYRAWLIRIEIAWGVWVFVFGPVALMSVSG